MPDKVIEIPGVGVVSFPDSMSDDEVSAQAAKLHQQGTQTPSEATPSLARRAYEFGSKTLPEAIQGVGRAAIGALPTAGGIAGGLAAGVPGAIAGGVGGEAARQLIAGDTPSFTKVAEQGAAMGAAEGAGKVAVAAGTGLSKWLMNRATSRVTSQLAREFPELTDTLIDNALTVSEGGYGKAKGLLLAAKAKATSALTAADATGATIPVQMTPTLAESLKAALLEKAIKGGKLPNLPGQPLITASERDPALQHFFQNVIDKAAKAGSVLNLPPTAADLLKTQLQRESRALYLNRIAANGPKAIGQDATELAEFASRLNDAVGALSPGYRAANAEAQPLIGAVRGLKQAIRPSGNLYQAMVRPAVGGTIGAAMGSQEGGSPGAALGAVLGAAMTSPAGMSKEAILLAHPIMQTVLKQLPKPTAQALIELLQGSTTTEGPASGAGPQ